MIKLRRLLTVKPFTPLTISLLCLLAWLPMNVWASADISVSWVAIGYLLFGIALYITLCYSSALFGPSLGAAFLLFIGSVLTISSLPIVAWKSDFRLFQFPLYDYLQSLPFHSTETIHPNVLAGALVIVLPLFVGVILQHKWIGARWLQSVCMIMMLVVLATLILTQSRAGYLATTIALLCILCLRWPSLILYIVPLIGLTIIISPHFITVQDLMEKFSADGSLGGWDVRLDIWRNSLQALSDFAYTGIGIGTFTMVMPLLYPLQYPIEGYPHAHNLFLQIGLDLGIPGLIAYLALLINLVAMLIVTLRKAPRHTMIHTLAIGAAGSLVGMLTHGLLDAVTWGTKLSFLPWILFALITQLFLHVQKEELASVGEENPKPA